VIARFSGLMTAALVAAVIAVAGCGTVVTAGGVIAKRHLPAHLTVSSSGAEGWDDEAWQVEVEAGNDVIKWFTVSQKVYDELSVGSFVRVE
jgi:hypothetical protein